MIKYVILFLLSISLYGQVNWEAGLSYGNSNVLRSDAPNFYNYKNQEYGGFVRFNKPFKNSSQHWKKYWNVESNVVLSQYEHLYNQKKSSVVRIDATIGLSLKFPIEKLDLRLNAKFGPGYHNGYDNRLHKGLVFSEAISVQGSMTTAFKWSPIIRLGLMHVSNGNFYSLNKGLEVVYIKVGWQIKTSPSKHVRL